MTDQRTPDSYDYDQSPPENAPAPRQRRTRAPRPLNDPRVRKLVAGILQNHINDLLEEPSLSDQFIADQLDDVVNELLDVD